MAGVKGPTKKQRENTERKVAETVKILTNNDLVSPEDAEELAKKIVTHLEAPILRMLADEERSRTRLVKMIKAQDRLIEAYKASSKGGFLTMRENGVTQARYAINQYGDMNTHDIPEDGQ